MTKPGAKGINVHRFCEGFGIRVRPIHHAKEPRPPNVIYGGRTIARMLRRKGPDHTGLVLMCIQASDPACLYGDTIRAVSEFLKVHHAATGGRQDAIAHFRVMDIAELRTRAQRLARRDSEALSSTVAALAVLLANTIIGEDAA
jgi:hypothetical protein